MLKHMLRRARGALSDRLGGASIHELELRRDEAYRRVNELRRYAGFCELEAKCWPEDSSDRAELVAYAEVARLQADETLRRWRDLERALRAERFERITGKRMDKKPQ
jgi:hypothetical protein